MGTGAIVKAMKTKMVFLILLMREKGWRRTQWFLWVNNGSVGGGSRLFSLFFYDHGTFFKGPKLLGRMGSI